MRKEVFRYCQNGKKMTIMRVMGKDKVETIKEYAEMIIGIPKEDQIILFKNKKVREGERIEDLGI